MSIKDFWLKIKTHRFMLAVVILSLLLLFGGAKIYQEDVGREPVSIEHTAGFAPQSSLNSN